MKKWRITKKDDALQKTGTRNHKQEPLLLLSSWILCFKSRKSLFIEYLNFMLNQCCHLSVTLVAFRIRRQDKEGKEFRSVIRHGYFGSRSKIREVIVTVHWCSVSYSYEVFSMIVTFHLQAPVELKLTLKRLLDAKNSTV